MRFVSVRVEEGTSTTVTGISKKEGEMQSRISCQRSMTTGRPLQDGFTCELRSCAEHFLSLHVAIVGRRRDHAKRCGPSSGQSVTGHLERIADAEFAHGQVG